MEVRESPAATPATSTFSRHKGFRERERERERERMNMPWR
jgi:hypothetical protein